MGAVYKGKRLSRMATCPICKPHKVGWEKKHTRRQRMKAAEAQRDVDEARSRNRCAERWPPLGYAGVPAIPSRSRETEG